MVPHIWTGLRFSATSPSWVMNGYTFTFGVASREAALLPGALAPAARRRGCPLTSRASSKSRPRPG
jgi:hypothetical protein